MKNEYLCRTATFTTKNIEKLFEEAGEELVGRPECDIVDVLTIAAASRFMRDAISVELSTGGENTAVSMRGEDFAVKTDLALARIGRASMYSHTERVDGEEDATLTRVFAVLGACVCLGGMVEEKLYGSDHVEEHEAIKKEESNE